VISESLNDKNAENNLLVITGEDPAYAKTCTGLAEKDYILSVMRPDNFLSENIDKLACDLVILFGDNDFPAAEILRKIKQKQDLPAIVLVKKEALSEVNGYLNMADDFLVWPGDKRELIIRINRLLKKSSGDNGDEQIICNDLMINLATCEVTVNGIKAELTFKEYELLKLLAGNKGRVFTRQTLLDKIWGYDYFGGDRTVDVHVRRLRSKIENGDLNYIETVRNIGYRFAKDA
jgi:DNA-binding response OmpR family regulator